MKVQRITLAGTEQAVTFSTKCGKWLVKNFSDNDLYISFEQNAAQADAIKVEKKCGQVVVENEFLGGLEIYKHNTIYLRGTGEVEVQQLCWH